MTGTFMKSIRTVLLPPLLLALTLLQGCGFHLRGEVSLLNEMSSTWIAGQGVSSGLTHSVGNAIRNSNGDTARSEKEASAILLLSNESFSRQVATVGSDGKVSEYQLSYQLDWELSNKQGTVLREGTLKQRENYQYSANQLLGKSQEEKHLRQRMVREVTRDLMRSLRQK
jgi:LPS-assembly lipoprotein